MPELNPLDLIRVLDLDHHCMPNVCSNDECQMYFQMKDIFEHRHDEANAHSVTALEQLRVRHVSEGAFLLCARENEGALCLHARPLCSNLELAPNVTWRGRKTSHSPLYRHIYTLALSNKYTHYHRCTLSHSDIPSTPHPPTAARHLVRAVSSELDGKNRLKLWLHAGTFEVLMSFLQCDSQKKNGMTNFTSIPSSVP